MVMQNLNSLVFVIDEQLRSKNGLIPSLTKQLKLPSVPKGFFAEQTTGQIISILDRSCSSLRILFMTVLVEMYPKIASILNVTTKKFQHPTQHP
jgi:hypothetical protein